MCIAVGTKVKATDRFQQEGIWQPGGTEGVVTTSSRHVDLVTVTWNNGTTDSMFADELDIVA